MKAYISKTSDWKHVSDDEVDIPDLASLLMLLEERRPTPLILTLRDDGDLDIEVYDGYRE